MYNEMGLFGSGLVLVLAAILLLFIIFKWDFLKDQGWLEPRKRSAPTPGDELWQSLREWVEGRWGDKGLRVLHILWACVLIILLILLFLSYFSEN